MGVVRNTKAVKTVLKLFQEVGLGLSVVHLVQSLRTEMNKTTVYRVLERLESEGELHSFIGKDGLKWYAKCGSCTSHSHPHFQCNTCGKTECLTFNIPLPVQDRVKIASAELLLFGECEDCLA